MNVVEKTEEINIAEKKILTNSEKVKKGIKSVLKKINIKKIGAILLIFVSCYISMELLNGITEFTIGEVSTFADVSLWISRVLKKVFFSAIVLFPLYLIMKSLVGKTKFTCTFLYTIIIIFSIANYIVTKVRGISITISDFYAIKTAINVAKGIKIKFGWDFFFGILAFVVSNIVLWKYIKFDEKKSKKRIRFSEALLGIILIYGIFNSQVLSDIKIWDINVSYKESGVPIVIARMIHDLKVPKPENYNSEQLKEVLAQYKDDTDEYEGKIPNVIVVMNESFADVNDLFNIDVSEDNLPYYHQLINGEDVVSGFVHSSKYGGGTATVEYEFLTQNTVSFLPSGAIPYQQYIFTPIKQSMVSIMNKLNYHSYGIHSWYKSGYSREKIYKLLGFKDIMFYEDMPNLRLDISNYSSDESTYEYIYNILENKDENEKVFQFVVTVQNHLPFWNIDDNGTQFKPKDQEVNGYLQDANRSDQALKKLVDYLKEYDEDTILLFFGDHQPPLDLENKYGSNGKYSVEETSYVVPFIIWANYDIEEKSGIETSTNYLQNILYSVANMPKDSYTKYIDNLQKDIPIITQNYYIDKDGKKWDINDRNSPYYEKIIKYGCMTYYQLFEN